MAKDATLGRRMFDVCVGGFEICLGKGGGQGAVLKVYLRRGGCVGFSTCNLYLYYNNIACQTLSLESNSI